MARIRWRPGMKSPFLRAVARDLRKRLECDTVWLEPHGVGDFEDGSRRVILRAHLIRRRFWGWGPVRSATIVDIPIARLDEAILDMVKRSGHVESSYGRGLTLAEVLYWKKPEREVARGVANALAVELREASPG